MSINGGMRWIIVALLLAVSSVYIQLIQLRLSTRKAENFDFQARKALLFYEIVYAYMLLCQHIYANQVN
jgi:hypothetical protein